MKKPSKSSTPSGFSSSALAEQGREALRVGRFKEAVEHFKVLVKRDPQPEWQALLADAYAGRARALAAKGMFEEARIVLDNTARAGQPVRESWLYLVCLIRQGRHDKAADFSRRCLGEWKAKLPAEETARIAELAEAWALAGVAGAPALAPGGVGASALAAWCAGAPAEEVARTAKGLSLRSPAKPLRLVLECLLAPDQEAEKRRRLLAMIPDDSPFAALRQAAAVALDSADAVAESWRDLSAARRTFIAAYRRIPPATAKLLDGFANARRQGPQALLAVLLDAAGHLPKPAVRAACLELLPQVPERLPQVEAKLGRLSDVDRNRILALAYELNDDWGGAESCWLETIDALKSEGGEFAALAQAVIYRHLADKAVTRGDILGEEECDDPVSFYLERAVEADPEHLPTIHAILRNYRSAGQTGDWRRWVEWAIPRFPADATVLEAAVEAAAERDAYKKAAVFARKLLAVDPINQPARRRMIELKIAHARKQMRAGRVDLAAKELAGAEEWLRPGTSDAPLVIAQGFVGLRLQPGPESEARLREGVRMIGPAAPGWFRAALEAALMGWSDAEIRSACPDMAAAMKVKPDKEAVLAVIAIVGMPEIRADERLARRALPWIEPFLAKAAGLDYSPAEFGAIAEILHETKQFKLLAKFARHAGDRFYQIVARIEGNARRLSRAEENHLLDLADQAQRQQDYHAVNRIGRLLGGGPAPVSARAGGGKGGLEDVLDDLQMFVGDIGTLVEELGIDGALDAIMDMIRMLEKTGRERFPVPLDMAREAFRAQILEGLNSSAPAPRPAPHRRRRNTTQTEFDF